MQLAASPCARPTRAFAASAPRARAVAAPGARPGAGVFGARPALRRRGAAAAAVRPAAAAAAASFGGEGAGEVNVFPRFKERDPYRLLGVSREATYEEIQDARNFLAEQHKSHVPGREAIDLAFDKIIDQKLKERKKSKGIKLDKKKRDDDVVVSLGPLDKLRDAIVVPPRQLIFQRFFVYAFLVAWSLYQAAASGPAFQVAVGFALTAYYVHDKRGGKNLWGALGQALLGLFLGWLAGSIIPVYLPLFPPSVSPETVASVFAFASLFATATFFK